MTRQDGRAYDELRPIKITTDFVKFPEGSCLIECGDTKVLCCASIEEKTPPHVAEGEGWVTAEYSMLPRANRERSKRDISKLKLSPRSAEIQRLVGRSLRAAVDMKALGERTINIDCDVLQGDGGTRTASVTGGFVALALACRKLVADGVLTRNPIRHQVAAVSCGIVDDTPCLDLCYQEDSHAQVDMNFVMNDQGNFIEMQGTGEGRAFTPQELQTLMEYGRKGIADLMQAQRDALGERAAHIAPKPLLVAATGGRLDHLLGNLQILAFISEKAPGTAAEILGSHERVWLLDGGSLSIQGKPESTFSVLCHSDRAEGVTIRGARFGLENAVMTNRFPLGISNRIGEERIATISVEKGILFVIYPKEV